MATIRKRIGNGGDITFHVQVRLKGYQRETATFERKADAKRWAAQVETEMREGRYFGQSKRHTFEDLAEKYEKNASDKGRLGYWKAAFKSTKLVEITPVRIMKERDKLLAGITTRFAEPQTNEPKANGARARSKRSGGTVNRYLAALSSCLSYGVKTLQWLEKNPCEQVQKPKESKGRVRFLSDKERERLIVACRKHPTLYTAVVLSLTTGARQGEIMGLRWPQIDFTRKVIVLEKTKNGDRRVIPLVGEAYELLWDREIKRTMDDRIFPPSHNATKADVLDLRAPWLIALAEAEITDFRWHDLRHTAASYLAMSGVSMVEIAKVLGHRTLQMVARYSHLSDEHVVATGEKLASRLGFQTENYQDKKNRE
jgi:integrase